MWMMTIVAGSGDSEEESDAEENDDHPQSKHMLKTFVVRAMPKRFIDANPDDAVKLFIELKIRWGYSLIKFIFGGCFWSLS
jgi:hypothetical protein